MLSFLKKPSPSSVNDPKFIVDTKTPNPSLIYNDPLPASALPPRPKKKTKYSIFQAHQNDPICRESSQYHGRRSAGYCFELTDREIEERRVEQQRIDQQQARYGGGTSLTASRRSSNSSSPNISPRSTSTSSNSSHSKYLTSPQFAPDFKSTQLQQQQADLYQQRHPAPLAAEYQQQPAQYQQLQSQPQNVLNRNSAQRSSGAFLSLGVTSAPPSSSISISRTSDRFSASQQSEQYLQWKLQQEVNEQDSLDRQYSGHSPAPSFSGALPLPSPVANRNASAISNLGIRGSFANGQQQQRFSGSFIQNPQYQNQQQQRRTPSPARIR